MADNITQPGIGEVIAADDVGGAKYQRVKMVWGADGAVNDTSAAAPAPITFGADTADLDSGGSTDAHPVVAIGVPASGGHAVVPGDGTNGLKVQVASALPAGTNAVGKLAANSGVDIGDVDITSVVGDNADMDSGAGTDNHAVVGIAVPASGGHAVVPGDATNGLKVQVATIAAGTNAIGKLAANSGVDIGDVDVTTVPADPFGANADSVVAAGAAGSIQAKLRRATQGLEDLKSLIVLAAGTNRIGHVLKDVAASVAGAAYRSAVVAADLMAAPGTVTCTKLTGVGSLTAGEYIIKVVAVNTHGRTTATAGNTHVTTETTNLGVRAAFAQVTGATHYDIYCSIDSDPLWSGRVTEAQRASGIVIDTVGHTTAGGTAGAVDIYAIGTGRASATSAAVNTAYVIPASPIDCSGYQYVDFDLLLTLTGDGTAPGLSVIPFYLNATETGYVQGTKVDLTFGGTSASYNSKRQRVRVETRGCSGVALLVQSIAGTGASLTIYHTLS